MLHGFYFFARKPSLSSASFHHHYLALHTQSGMRQKELGVTGGETRPPHMRRYIQNHRIHSLGGNSPFDAVSETWSEVESRGSGQLSMRDNPNSPFKRDEPNFIDLSRIGFMNTTDQVIVDGPRKSGMVQGQFQLTHKMGLTIEEFRSYWAEVHAPIVKALPGLRHYQQAVVRDEVYGLGDPRWDGVEQVWFDDYAQAQRAINSVEFQRSLLPDFANFSETPWYFFAEARLVMWPGQTRDESLRSIAERVRQPWLE